MGVEQQCQQQQNGTAIVSSRWQRCKCLLHQRVNAMGSPAVRAAANIRYLKAPVTCCLVFDLQAMAAGFADMSVTGANGPSGLPHPPLARASSFGGEEMRTIFITGA